MNLKMHTILFATVVSGTIAGTSVSAQDWNGGYWGATLGYGAGSYDQGVLTLGEFGPTVDVDGAFLGLRYGRNWQAGTAVWGFDADISSGIDGITPQGTSGPVWNCTTGACNVSIEALLTLRGRYGLLIDPQTLVYGAAGIAAGKIEGGIFSSSFQGSSTAVGYTLAAGAERTVSDKMSVFAELNHVDLGVLEFGRSAGLPPIDYDGEGSFSTVRIGVNIRF